MLAGACFRDDAFFAHASREQSLSESVIDLVRAGVKEVLALQVDACATKLLSQSARKKQRCRASRKLVQQLVQLQMERGIAFRFFILELQFLERRHERFGDVPPAVGTEPSGRD